MTKLTETIICLLHKEHNDGEEESSFFSDMNNEISDVITYLRKPRNYIKLKLISRNAINPSYITIEKHNYHDKILHLYICKQQEIILMKNDYNNFIDVWGDIWKEIVTLTNPDSLNQLDNYLIKLLDQINYD